MLKNYKFYIENLDCANCAKKIENEISKDSRFKNVVVNFNLMTLTFKSDILNPFPEIVNIVRRVEPDTLIYQEKKEENKKDYEIIRLFFAILLLVVSFFIKNKSIYQIILVSIYVLLLYKTVIKAVKKIVKSHHIDENLLISISAIGAYILGEHMEGIMVVLLYVIGKILEDKAVNKSRNEIKNLLDLKINYANLEENNKIRQVKSENLKINDIIVVKKGEAIPADGIIIEGETLLDTSSLTGESALAKAEVNTQVLSGSINCGDVVKIKVTHLYYESMAYKIFELTMNATNHKAKTETKVTKFAIYYTPMVLLIAILIGVTLPFMTNLTYGDSIYRALTFLVISCPCAIAISVPLSYFAGIGASSKAKVLVKGSNFLDEIPKCDTIVFDKTGTLTTGAFKIAQIDIYDKKYKRKDVLYLTGLGESFSNHPIAKVILNEITEELEIKKVKDFKEIDGKGILYQVDGKKIKVGSAKFVGTNKKANIFLSVDEKLIAGFIFDDNVKTNASHVIAELKKQKMNPMMLTGDNESFAKIVADKVGIDDYACELLPDQKFAKLEMLIKEHKVIFVGDGINDTPSIVLANVGISMGSIGTNSAIEASDVVIMNDNLEGIIHVLKIARKTNHIISMNLIFAIGTKILILILATLGYASMWAAIFADTGVTLITILNSLRILKK